MIVKLFNHPYIVYQTPNDPDADMPGPAIGVHVDSGGCFCLEQEDRQIHLERATAPELCRLLMRLKKEIES